MPNVAAFVDAGYLYAVAGNAANLVAARRVDVDLNVEAVVQQLKNEAAALDGGGNRLVRIYWYDGQPRSGRTPDQTRTAMLPDVKLRLGTINSQGEQKGVDALLVNDLSELARNRAMDSAILLSGDEDILVGVETAQSFGVRLHLVGIDPKRTQAEKLRLEADACHEWPLGLVASWVRRRTDAFAPSSASTLPGMPSYDQMAALVPTLSTLPGREREVAETWERERRIPAIVDSALMRALSATLQRPLAVYEKPQLRRLFIDALRGNRPEAPEEAELADDGELAEEAGEGIGSLDGAAFDAADAPPLIGDADAAAGDEVAVPAGDDETGDDAPDRRERISR